MKTLSLSLKKEKVLGTLWKLGVMTTLVVLFLLAEFLLSNVFGRLFKPELVLLLVIFFDLYSGVRYGLFVAFLGGFLKDSFGADPFGAVLSSYVLCVYVTTLIKRYLFYEIEFGFLRIFITVLVVFFNAMAMALLVSFLVGQEGRLAVFLNMLPGVITTSLISPIVYKYLKECVLKLSI